MVIIWEIFAILGLWIGIILILDDGDSKPLKGMSNPILFDHIKDKHFK